LISNTISRLVSSSKYPVSLGPVGLNAHEWSWNKNLIFYLQFLRFVSPKKKKEKNRGEEENIPVSNSNCGILQPAYHS